MKKRNIEILSADKSTPIVLIVGEDSITSIIAQKLEQSDCDIVELKEYPKSGRFHYIFQFGNAEFVNKAYIKYLKPEGKLLFIDIEDENIDDIVSSTKVRILKTGSLSYWDKQKLSEKILKAIFVQSSAAIIDIRKSPVASYVKSKKSKGKAKEKEEEDVVSIEKDHYSDDSIAPKVVYRSFSKRFIALGLIVIILIFTSFLSTWWYISSFKQSLYDLKNHIAISDWKAVGSDLKDTRYKLKIATTIFNISDNVLFPFRETALMTNTGDFLTATDKFLSIGENAIVFLKDFKTSNTNVFAGYTFLSEENYQQAIGTIDSLIQSAERLKGKSEALELPYFPKKDIVSILTSTLTELTSVRKVLPVFKRMFITDNQKTYLLLFQNNMELRPTGGFIGSVGFLTIVQGKVVDLKIMDVYTIDGQLKGHVEPPSAIREHFSQPNWFLRDSNFDPDFAVSALQAEWFLQKTINRSVDGVIAVDLFFVQNLLSVVGPVTLTDFNNEVISADNLFLKAQLLIQKDFFPGSTQKKDFLTSVAKAIEIKIASSDNLPWFKLFSEVQSALERKDIMIYVNDEDLQLAIEKLGWAGRMVNIRCVNDEADCLADYLSINESNFGVNKANYFVSKSISIEKTINDQDQIVTDLEVSYENKSMPQILEGGPYVNYLRVFVPRESTVISITFNNVAINVDDIDVDNYQSDKKVFGLLLKIAPDNKGVVKISYVIPNKITSADYYQFYLQKQAGDKISPINLSFKQSNKYKFIPLNFQTVSESNQQINHSSDTTVDRVFSLEVK